MVGCNPVPRRRHAPSAYKAKIHVFHSVLTPKVKVNQGHLEIALRVGSLPPTLHIDTFFPDYLYHFVLTNILEAS